MGRATTQEFRGNRYVLKPRIIPVLLVLGDGLIKTINFRDPLYIGDPINAVRIFNDKEVDELVVGLPAFYLVVRTELFAGLLAQTQCCPWG